MEKVTGRRKKVSLNGISIKKVKGILLLFNGKEQIGPFGKNVDAITICLQIVISKKCLKNKR